MSKIKATKTVNPLHFEDLEPHRFEDLVRRLLYTFRDWKDIEATGRGGSDDGFDARAWEREETITNVNEEGEEGAHSLDGRLWQIQGKREKSITPTRMRSLIRDGVDQTNPPYGYILAAATNISKTSFDVFREELKKKGVKESYFWGKDYLEDQLSLPQNDEILFTFFGLSLSPRRRSRTSEVKFAINNKNKILKLVFSNEHLHSHQAVPRNTGFLLRDIKAEHYPFSQKYSDFERHRRWEEHNVVEVHATGVLFSIRERYAYFDEIKKGWDFSTTVDLTPRKQNLDRANQARFENEGRKVERFWRHLPLRHQAKLMVYGFVPFTDMLIIDEKGDPEHTDPHILIDFSPNGPFRYSVPNLVHGGRAIGEDEFGVFKKMEVFPKSYPEPVKTTVHEIAKLNLTQEAADNLKYLRGARTLYVFDKKLKTVSEGNIIHLPQRDEHSSDKYAEVTHVEKTTVKAILADAPSEYYRRQLNIGAGREVTDSEELVVYELHEVMRPSEDGYLVYFGDDSHI
jgi:hypothetical protein